jgi:NitT/TauT family transport system substrate-binding protein
MEEAEQTVEFVAYQPEGSVDAAENLAADVTDFDISFPTQAVFDVDRGLRHTLLGGFHATCYRLFARDGIDSPAALAGKRVGIGFGSNPSAGDVAFMTWLVHFVGIRDAQIVSLPADEVSGALTKGEFDAVLTVPDTLWDLAAGEGYRVILDGSVDPPYSGLLCCMAVGNRRFIRRNPNTTREVLRAILKSADVFANQPQEAARYLAQTYGVDEDAMLHVIDHSRYDVWRTFDSADSLRFYANRMREVGDVKVSAEQVLKQTDYRFLQELKGEMARAQSLASFSSQLCRASVDSMGGAPRDQAG